MLRRPDEFVPLLIGAIDTRDRILAESDFYQEFEETILLNPVPYFSIPIIFNLILLVSNLLASFGAIFHIFKLFYPWLIFYFLSIVSTFSFLVYIIVILENNWFRVILFLVVVPFLVLASSFWSVIFKLARRVRISQRKVTSKTFKIPLAPQDSNSVSHPVPVRTLAVSPPEAAWDPEYLIEQDPRYVVGPGETESAGNECEEDEDSYGYRDSYADRRGSGSEWESDEETDYLSDEYTDMADREDTEDFTESEADTLHSFPGKRKYTKEEHVTDTDNFTEFEEKTTESLHSDQTIGNTSVQEQSEANAIEAKVGTNQFYENVNFAPSQDTSHYQTPGVPRPVIRADSPELYSMPGTTLHSSTA